MSMCVHMCACMHWISAHLRTHACDTRKCVEVRALEYFQCCVAIEGVLSTHKSDHLGMKQHVGESAMNVSKPWRPFCFFSLVLSLHDGSSQVWRPEKSERDAGKRLVVIVMVVVMVVVIRIDWTCVYVHDFIHSLCGKASCLRGIKLLHVVGVSSLAMLWYMLPVVLWLAGSN